MEERSAGAVVFSEKMGRRYLLLTNRGRWDFPKGNMERGESELDTVVREVGEETGLKALEVLPGFRREIEYFYRRDGKNVHKRVIYYLARTDEESVVVSAEHQGYGWFSFSDAVKRASYGNSRATLEAAERFVEGLRGSRAGASRPA